MCDSAPDRTVFVQRIESGAIAVFALAATVFFFPTWWWVPFAAFLLVDLSMVGYTRSPAAGATSYNLGHTYLWSAVLGTAAAVAYALDSGLVTLFALAALAWAFHVGVDRALGYGLKHPDDFTHTHLGRIGRARAYA